MKLKKVVLALTVAFLTAAPAYSMAAVYTGTGFIAKSFKVGNVSSATGSILYQKGSFKDTIVYEGITTNALTAEFTNYVEGTYLNKYVLPDPLGHYKFSYTTKEKKSNTYAKMKIECSAGVNWLVCRQN